MFPLRQLTSIAIVAAVSACSPRGQEALWFLSDIAAAGGPSRLKEETLPPDRQPVRFTVEDRSYEGDIYLPADGGLAAMVLTPGVSPEGKDDPRLVALAESLARVRFIVLVPELPGVRELRVGAENIHALVDTVHWMVGPGAVAPAGEVGIAALSYAVGPAVIASLDPRIRDNVGLIVSIGGYHDLHAVVTFMTTGYYMADGELHRREPNPFGKWVFLASNAERLDDPEDRERLRAIAQRRLESPAAPIDDLAAGLGRDGQTVLALITNQDPAQVSALIDQLPAAVRAEFSALNPAEHDLSALRADLLLIHGRDDPMIPHSESVALAERVPAQQSSLYLIDGLDHVDVDLSLKDQLEMWHAANELLARRDELSVRIAGR